MQRHHRGKSPQANILSKLTSAQTRQSRREHHDDNYPTGHEGRDNNQNHRHSEREGGHEQIDEGGESPRKTRNRLHPPIESPTIKESVDSLQYDGNKVLEPQEHFHERFGQDEAHSGSARGLAPETNRRRAQSVSPGRAGRIAASFNFRDRDSPNSPTNTQRRQSTDNESEQDIPTRDHREKNQISKRESIVPILENGRGLRDDREEDVIQPARTHSPSRKPVEDLLDSPCERADDELNSRYRSQKKVSYAQEQTERAPHPVPVSCRLRSECVEPDDSELNLRGLTMRCNARPAAESASSSYQASASSLLYRPSEPRRTDLFTVGNSIEECSLNPNNNNLDHFSFESIPEGVHSVSSTGLCRDVLPLPIEIPDDVDADAIRRYLSVRRGAITPDRLHYPFEKRNRTSYESLGRRPSRRSSMGLTPSRQLGHDASTRTASLSHAIMTIALLSASICQLRFILTYSPANAYPILNYFLIFTSIILEVAAGIGYVVVARCSFDDAQSEAIHNYLIVALFIVAISNVILAAFAFDGHLCDEIKKTDGHTTSTSSQDQQINQPVPRPDRAMDIRYMPLE